MSRPLMRLSVDELESMFAAQASHPPSLTALADELKQRTTERAVALLARVERELAPLQANPTAQPGSTAASRTRGAVAAEPGRNPSLVDASADQHAQVKSKGEIPSRQASARAPMTEDAAYALLGVSRKADWQWIEKTREKLVAESSPSALAGQPVDVIRTALEKARRVNEAYSMLSKVR